MPGPRLLVAGNYVSSTGGAGDARQFSIFVDVPIVRNLADGPDEIVKAVRTNFKNGADFIKILATGAVLSKGIGPARSSTRTRRSRPRSRGAALGAPGGRARARHRGHQGRDPRRRAHDRPRLDARRRGDRDAEGRGRRTTCRRSYIAQMVVERPASSRSPRRNATRRIRDQLASSRSSRRSPRACPSAWPRTPP